MPVVDICTALDCCMLVFIIIKIVRPTSQQRVNFANFISYFDVCQTGWLWANAGARYQCTHCAHAFPPPSSPKQACFFRTNGARNRPEGLGLFTEYSLPTPPHTSVNRLFICSPWALTPRQKNIKRQARIPKSYSEGSVHNQHCKRPANPLKFRRLRPEVC